MNQDQYFKIKAETSHKLEVVICQHPTQTRNICQVESPYLGRYAFQGTSFYCSQCNKEYHDILDPELLNREYIARQQQIEYLLRKNYPLNKFEYLTEFELINQVPDIKRWESQLYFIKEDNQRLYPRLYLEIRRFKKYLINPLFNLTIPDDWDSKKDDTEALMQYFPPDESIYLSEEEILQELEDSPFPLNKQHLDFFTHNMLVNDRRIYLHHSYIRYRKNYTGLLDLFFESEWWDDDEEIGYY